MFLFSPVEKQSIRGSVHSGNVISYSPYSPVWSSGYGSLYPFPYRILIKTIHSRIYLLGQRDLNTMVRRIRSRGRYCLWMSTSISSCSGQFPSRTHEVRELTNRYYGYVELQDERRRGKTDVLGCTSRWLSSSSPTSSRYTVSVS